MLFAEEAALVTHTEQQLQSIMDSFSPASRDLSMTISIKKTNMCQGVKHPPEITVSNKKLEVVNEFTYLGSTVSVDLALDTETDRHIGRAASPFASLLKWVWENGKLTIHMKVAVYRASSAPSSMAASLGLLTPDRKRDWTHSICEIYGTSSASSGLTAWQTPRSSPKLESRTSTPQLLQQRSLRWLELVHGMADRRIPKDPLYSEPATCKRACGCPHLRFRDVCKGYLKSTDIDIESWEELASDRVRWIQELRKDLDRLEAKERRAAEDKMVSGKEQPDGSPPGHSLQVQPVRKRWRSHQWW